ncbi:MAG TPA: TIGR02300 family protein [Arsenicitalea sp.]|jgi:uncharacterized protein (TIGR02300 family)|nr:TIGR02300 family protein [Arsenicitalea sp.]
MASFDRGTKREDPDTGRKFYDLNKDPIVSPFTGKSYPRSFFEQTVRGKAAAERAVPEDDEEEVEVEEVADAAAPEIVSLDEVEAEEAGDEEIPDVEGVEDVEDIGEDDADVFLEEDEDEDDNLDFDVGSGDER